ncbi:MAG: PHP domain-containing protein, partial [Deltaproteobacteria bacterium]|nr:PHP domain-containing protein [Deltaproteobacteria bacterium]
HVWDLERVRELSERHGLPVFRGNEITTDQGDVIVFGLEEEVKGIIQIGDLREKVLRAGGVMIAAHPFRGFLMFNVGQLGLTPEKAAEREIFRLVDAVEILNGKVTEKENAFASNVAAALGISATGGSDAHEVSEVGVYATRFPSAIRNEEDLVAALKRGDCEAIAYRQAGEPA